ncbi:MAG: hypothetical protein EA380_04700 [Phycisphaeraceae bacterium]|nr:MAG: hypothetical protein EA380_04700 [Phycisphaeraceae bacterium]
MESARQTMDFFGHQDAARKRTRTLIILYTLSVLLICSVVGILAAVIGAGTLTYNSYHEDTVVEPTMFQIALIGLAGFGMTGLIIAGGSAYRINELRSGGLAVALALGGKPIDPDTKDPDERLVLNVVEEMAIASGVPIPPVFILPNEPAINAFAAGYTTGDAVIGVTHGCVHGLTRDELQGVMAHEFSHILNGDMRLNIRMIGLLNGILLLTIIGHIMLRSAFYGRAVSRDSRNAGIPIAIIGGLLIAVGAIGVLMSRIIQAAVSRQREFLADAAAVQFTRNPEGIANALRRIGGASKRGSDSGGGSGGGGGRIRSEMATEVNHMFFASGLSSNFLATHPPLPARIKRIYPAWDGKMLAPLRVAQRADAARPDRRHPAQRVQETVSEKLGALGEPRMQQAILLPLLAGIGSPTPAHLDHARRLIDAIPQSLKDAARDPYSARAVVHALLLDARADIRDKQYQRLDSHAEHAITQLVRKLEPDAIKLDRTLRLPLLDLALPGLGALSEKQYAIFRANLQALVEADGVIDIFEWCLLRVVEKHLDEHFNPSKRIAPDCYSLARLTTEVSTLLSTLAHAGAPDPSANPDEAQRHAARAFTTGAAHLNLDHLALIDRADCSFAKLETALTELNRVVPKIKQQLLTAAALTVAADHAIAPAEAELLRAIADIMGVPTPPLLPGQKLV